MSRFEVPFLAMTSITPAPPEVTGIRSLGIEMVATMFQWRRRDSPAMFHLIYFLAITDVSR